MRRGSVPIEAPQGMLIAYSSAPGTVAPDTPPGPYGPYATAIAEMLRAPGIDLDTAFTHIRSRTHLSTDGRQTPWHVADIGEPIELVPPEAATANLPPPPPRRVARPMREIGPDEAYALAIEMDTLDHYVEFVEAYPQHAYSERVWAIIRARREALAWMRALEINTPQAYWTYLRRYPNGMYAYDAERRLRRLSAPLAPPPDFAMLAFAGVPLALRDEPREYRPVYRVGPPPPRRMMRPPPAFLVSLPPPPRRSERQGSAAALGANSGRAAARARATPRTAGRSAAGRRRGPAAVRRARHHDRSEHGDAECRRAAAGQHASARCAAATGTSACDRHGAAKSATWCSATRWSAAGSARHCTRRAPRPRRARQRQHREVRCRDRVVRRARAPHRPEVRRRQRRAPRPRRAR